jgi:hypothetical protein
MKLENFTPMDDATLRAIIRSVCPSNVSRFTIAFKNSRYFSGAAYASGITGGRYAGAGRDGPYVSCKLATARLGVAWARQYRFVSFGAYLGICVATDVEAVLALVAHELRHLWQRKVRRGFRVHGSRGQFSERDADAYALRMLRRYRRGELEIRPQARGSFAALPDISPAPYAAPARPQTPAERLFAALPLTAMDAAFELDCTWRQANGYALTLIRAGRARWRGRTLVAARGMA